MHAGHRELGLVRELAEHEGLDLEPAPSARAALARLDRQMASVGEGDGKSGEPEADAERSRLDNSRAERLVKTHPEIAAAHAVAVNHRLRSMSQG